MQQVFCIAHAKQKTCFHRKDRIMTYRSQYSDRCFLLLNEQKGSKGTHQKESNSFNLSHTSICKFQQLTRYHSFNNLPSCYAKTQIKIYKTIILPVVPICVKLGLSYSRELLRRYLAPKMEETTVRCRKLHKGKHYTTEKGRTLQILTIRITLCLQCFTHGM